MLGREERARALAGKLMAFDPAFCISRWIERMLAPRVLDPRIYEPVTPALVAAGVPE